MRAARGDEEPKPPAPVGELPAYLAACAQVAVNRADWDKAIDYTDLVVEGGVRSAEVLMLRCEALRGKMYVEDDLDPSEQLERLATGVLANQQDTLEILGKIDEINGLLIDLVS